MKRLTFTFLVLLMTLLFSCALSENAVFEGRSFPTDAESIDLEDTVVKDFDAFYDFLSRFDHLKHVDMFATRMPLERIEEITARFPDLEFGWTMVFAEHTVRTDVTAFSTLHYAKAVKHPDEYISLVRYCKNLKALDFGHNAVRDLSFLYELPELRVLIMAVNYVTDITPLASLKHLEYLEMFNNYVTDLSPIANLTNLIDLNIGWNRIQDLSPILGLKNLKRLWCGLATDRDNRVFMPKGWDQKIREAIPGIDIFIGENPTGGSWRSHPHHFVVRDIFADRVYRPFEDSFPDAIVPSATFAPKATAVPEGDVVSLPDIPAEETGAATEPPKQVTITIRH